MNMNMPAFDTYKAVQDLKKAGFEEAQATAVVSTIRAATSEDIASLREDIAALPTKDDIEKAIAEALKPYTTKEDLKSFALREDLKSFATREDLKSFATKEDLAMLETRMIKYLIMTVFATAGLVATIMGLLLAIAEWL